MPGQEGLEPFPRSEPDELSSAEILDRQKTLQELRGKIQDAKDKEIEQLESDLTQARSLIGELVEALKPFADEFDVRKPIALAWFDNAKAALSKVQGDGKC